MLVLQFDNSQDAYRDAEVLPEAHRMVDRFEHYMLEGHLDKHNMIVSFPNMLFFHAMRYCMMQREVDFALVEVLGSDNHTHYSFDNSNFHFSKWSECFKEVTYNPELQYISKLFI